MSLNGNRFKTTNERQPCPECLGYPCLVLRDGRLVPTCDRCNGAGTVAGSNNEKAAPEGGAQALPE